MIYRTSKSLIWAGGDTYKKMHEFDFSSNFNVLVLGNSHAYRGYDPRLFRKFGLEMYNLGSSAQSVVNTFFVAKHLIPKEFDGTILIELYPGSLETDGAESTLDIITNSKSNSLAFDVLINAPSISGGNLFVLRYFNKYFGGAMYDKEGYVENGYVMKTDSVKIDSFRYEEYLMNYNPQKENIQYLEQLILYLKKRRIKFLLVTHPLPKELLRENLYPFLKTVNDIAEKHKIEYWDYSYNHELSAKYHFYDMHHLNQSGVNIYNNIICERLAKKIGI